MQFVLPLHKFSGKSLTLKLKGFLRWRLLWAKRRYVNKNGVAGIRYPVIRTVEMWVVTLSMITGHLYKDEMTPAEE